MVHELALISRSHEIVLELSTFEDGAASIIYFEFLRDVVCFGRKSKFFGTADHIELKELLFALQPQR